MEFFSPKIMYIPSSGGRGEYTPKHRLPARSGAAAVSTLCDSATLDDIPILVSDLKRHRTAETNGIMHAYHNLVEKPHHVLVAIAVLVQNDIDDVLSRSDFLCTLLQAKRADDYTALRSSVDNSVSQPSH